jgi:hypothetical protein
VAAKFLINFLFLFFIISSVILFHSCSYEGPVEQEKMILIYTEMLLAQDSSDSASSFKSGGRGKGALPDSVKSAIFLKYKVSPAEYEETIAYYNEDQERWENFFKKTIDYLDSLKIRSGR